VAVCAASDTPVKPVNTEAINVQAYWEEPAPPPSAAPGMHRFALNVVAPRGFGFGRRPPPPPVDACHPAGSSETEPNGAPKLPARGFQGLRPGEYSVRLTVNGHTLTQPVTVKPDPRKLPAGAAVVPDDDDDE
jgi:hypothetical protein